MIELRCTCQITDDGKFIVSDVCAGCTECNLISELHPFGAKRIE